MSADAPTVPLIRRAMTSDLPGLGRLGALLVEAHHELDSRRFLAPNNRTPADYASFLGTKLEDPDAAILVAEAHGDVIGYAYAAVQGYDYTSLRGPAGVLHDLIVEPQHRGRGVGRLLLKAVLTYLTTRGTPRVVLLAAEGNQAAQRLFASMGFRRTMAEMTRELEEATRVRRP
jgi:ribosomal protein S18 acetylase RimI-like enzyme